VIACAFNPSQTTSVTIFNRQNFDIASQHQVFISVPSSEQTRRLRVSVELDFSSVDTQDPLAFLNPTKTTSLRVVATWTLRLLAQEIIRLTDI
jgi:hypothetical protein